MEFSSWTKFSMSSSSEPSDRSVDDDWCLVSNSEDNANLVGEAEASGTAEQCSSSEHELAIDSPEEEPVQEAVVTSTEGEEQEVATTNTEVPETVDVNDSASSSDVDIIDENYDEDALGQSYLHASTDLSVICPSDILHSSHMLPTVVCAVKKSTSSSDGSTQTEQPELTDNCVHTDSIDLVEETSEDSNLSIAKTVPEAEAPKEADVQPDLQADHSPVEDAAQIVGPVKSDAQKVAERLSWGVKEAWLRGRRSAEKVVAYVAQKKKAIKAKECTKVLLERLTGYRDTFLHHLESGAIFAVIACVALLFSVVFSIWLWNLGHVQSIGYPLRDAHHTIAVCLAKQHIAVLQDSRDPTIHFKVCSDKDGEYYRMIEKCAGDNRVMNLLAEVQKKLLDGEEMDISAYTKGITSKYFDVELIVRQLEYYKMLPRMLNADMMESPIADDEENGKSEFRKALEEENLLREMEETVANLTFINKLLKSQVQSTSTTNTVKRSEGKQNDAERFHPSDATSSGDPNRKSCTNVVGQLQEKIKLLIQENEKLKKEIAGFGCSEDRQNGEGAPCSKHKDSMKDTSRSDKHSKKEEEAEKAANMGYLNMISSLVKQIENLRGSLSDEISEVRKLNVLVENITAHIKSQFSTESDESQWSWQDLKDNVESMMQEAHKEISSKLSAFQKINITDVLNDYVEENKKQAEYVLNLVNDYIKATQETTNKILEQELPEMSNTAVNGMWKVWGTLKDQWTYVKEAVHTVSQNIRGPGGKRKEKKHRNDIEGDDEENKRNWYFLKSKSFENSKRHDAEFSSSKQRNDWLFRRASERAKLRQQEIDNLNWFLQRKDLRDKLRRKHEKQRG